MCTVTVVPLDEGFSLACNRDERRERPAAVRPAIHRLQRHLAIFPVDPTGGGTWIGVNDTGLAAVLLNRTTAMNAVVIKELSRGLIVPSVLDRSSIAEAIDTVQAIDVSRFNLFRLLIAQQRRGAVITSSGRSASIEHIDIATPYMITSSSLGDNVVQTPRRSLFEFVFKDGPTSWHEAQERFHSHQWRDRREVSVCMERPDARTVSQSFVSVFPAAIRFRYRPLSAPNAHTVAA